MRYPTWESLIQDITDDTDIGQLLQTFRRNKRLFDTELRGIRQESEKHMLQTDKELDENTERLEKIQKQQFTSNKGKQLAIAQQTQKLISIRIRRKNLEQDEIKLKKICEKFYQKYLDAVILLRTLLFNQPQNDIQSKGLNPETIQAFNIFTADESHVGDQCSICMEDIDVGRMMRRLTCDGQHYFCQQCIEGWFAEHNTCPLCRHKFD